MFYIGKTIVYLFLAILELGHFKFRLLSYVKDKTCFLIITRS